MNFQKKCQSARLFRYAHLLGTSEYKPNYRIMSMPTAVRSLKIMKDEKKKKWEVA